MELRVRILGAALAAGSGWAFVHQARGMIRAGVGSADGGGYTALLIGELGLWLLGIGLALS